MSHGTRKVIDGVLYDLRNGRRDIMPYGYNGKILRVDLDKESISVEEPQEAFYSLKIYSGI